MNLFHVKKVCSVCRMNELQQFDTWLFDEGALMKIMATHEGEIK
jgi:hypothetical protein